MTTPSLETYNLVCEAAVLSNGETIPLADEYEGSAVFGPSVRGDWYVVDFEGFEGAVIQ